MPAIIETTNSISKTMDELIDFMVKDEFLSKEFENFLLKNKIEIQKESELNEILISYILENKLQDGLRVLDYFIQKNAFCDKKTVNALKSSFVSVFKINKISSNCYTAFDMASESIISLIPLVKTVSLKGIGLYDFIKARVFEIDNNFYLLEIYDVINEYGEYFANLECIKSIIKNPKIAVLNNRDNFLNIKKSISSFHTSFIECFDSDEIILSNKEADNVLNDFYLYHTGKIKEKVSFQRYEADFKFFEIEEFKNENLIKNAGLGFSNSSKNYDIGFFSDNENGLFIIPFLGVFNEILKTGSLEIEGAIDCVKCFLTDDKVPPSLLIKKDKEYNSFIPIINQITKEDFKTVFDIIELYKDEYKDGLRLSPVSVLYNSKTFEKILNKKEEEKDEFRNIGRNDPCPCGSGKKYKKCCMK